jgi:hypothetical protein
MGPTLDERERQIDADYEWCLRDSEVHRAYGGKVVAAYQGKIWGSGKDHVSAWEAARQHAECPAKEVIAFVVVPIRDPLAS